MTSDAPTVRLYLIRHGQTDGNITQRLRGEDSAEDALTELGWQQARAVAEVLAAVRPPPVQVYASPYLRARQTGLAIAQRLGVPLTVLEGAQEIHAGDWRGRPYRDMHERAAEMTAPDGHFGYPGGESLRAVGMRFEAALLALPLQPEQAVVVVSHGAALTALLARLSGQDERDTWLAGQYQHRNAALTELLWTPGQPPQLLRIADAGHLDRLT
ncbi:histidine phosphatase family protein [Deinococcus sonorensis]|uniref:Histidine phosphatase family protein n=2 Tax=Deinococcus sonorensis TaxID=309891 RepID=A0AAU7UAP4_9DEIO